MLESECAELIQCGLAICNNSCSGTEGRSDPFCVPLRFSSPTIFWVRDWDKIVDKVYGSNVHRLYPVPKLWSIETSMANIQIQSLIA